jgi:Phage protein (N4 Gp49/phage Sf6 gene 66) family
MNTVTQEQIDALMAGAEVDEFIVFEKCLIRAYKFLNGFVLVGVGACVDVANFNVETGRQIANKQIEDRLWQLEAYRLQNQLVG